MEVAACPAPNASYSLSRALEEAGDAALLAQRLEVGVPAGQQLVRIALVPDVPDELVARRVEGVVERDRQLDDAKSRADVAAGARADIDQTGAHVVASVRSSSRVMPRKSAGDLTRSRMDMLNRMIRLENLATTHDSRSMTKRASTSSSVDRRPAALSAAQPVGNERPSALRGARDAEQRRVRALVKVKIPARGLSEAVGGGGDVENVVGDLKGESDCIAEPAQRRRAHRGSRRRKSRRERPMRGSARPSWRDESARAPPARAADPRPRGRAADRRSFRRRPKRASTPRPPRRTRSSTIRAPWPSAARRRRPAAPSQLQPPSRPPRRTRDAPSARPRRMSSSSMHGRSSWTSE